MRSAIRLLIVALVCLCLMHQAAPAVSLDPPPRAESDRSPVADAAGSDAFELSITTAGSALWQGSLAITANDTHAFLHKFFGLEVYDLTNPAAPIKIGQLFQPATVRDILLDGDFLYVAASYDGVLIYDIADPTAPILAAHVEIDNFDLPISANAQGVELDGFHLLVSAGSALIAIEVANPYAPSVLALIDPWGPASQSVTVNGITYVAADYYLSMWNLATPDAPILVGAASYPHDSWFVGSDGDRVFSCGRFDGLFAHPQTAGGNNLPVLASYPDTNHVWDEFVIYNDYIYLQSWDTIRIIDKSAPSVLSPVASLPSRGYAYSSHIHNDQLFISDWYEGFSSYDLTDPIAPSLTRTAAGPGVGYELVIDGDLGYQANGKVGLQVLDLADPEAPTALASLSLPGEAETIARAGSHLLLSGPDPMLSVVDVSIPSAPTLVTSLPLPSRCWKVAASGDLAIAATASELVLFDISTPGSPVQVSTFPMGTRANDLVIDGAYVYFGTDAGNLRIVDISNPAAPIEVSSSPLGASGFGVAKQGSYLYISVGYSGAMYAYDVSDPSNPIRVWDPGAINGYFARRMSISGNYLYTASFMENVKVYNLTDPSAPTLAGSYVTRPGWAHDVDFHNGALQITCDNGFLTAWQDGCGGPDGSGHIDPVDLSYLVDYFYSGGPGPVSTRAGDLNCSGDVDPLDLALLVDFMFAGGIPPCGGCF